MGTLGGGKPVQIIDLDVGELRNVRRGLSIKMAETHRDTLKQLGDVKNGIHAMLSGVEELIREAQADQRKLSQVDERIREIGVHE